MHLSIFYMSHHLHLTLDNTQESNPTKHFRQSPPEKCDDKKEVVQFADEVILIE
jgi:hypothetical protein